MGRAFTADRLTFLEAPAAALSSAVLRYTLMAWARPTSLATTGTFLGFGSSASGNYIAMAMSANTQQAFLELAPVATDTFGPVLDANVWQHVAATRDNDAAQTTRVFVGGESGAAVVGNPRPQDWDRTNVGSVTINGNRASNVEAEVAHVAVWDTVLTDAEIAALAGGANPLDVQPGHLLGYWPITGHDSPEPDLSGHGNPLAFDAAHEPLATATDPPVRASGGNRLRMIV